MLAPDDYGFPTGRLPDDSEDVAGRLNTMGRRNTRRARAELRGTRLELALPQGSVVLQYNPIMEQSMRTMFPQLFDSPLKQADQPREF